MKLAHVAKKSQVSGPGSTLSVLAAALLLVADASTPLKPPNPVPPPNVDAEPNTGVGDAAYVTLLQLRLRYGEYFQVSLQNAVAVQAILTSLHFCADHHSPYAITQFKHEKYDKRLLGRANRYFEPLLMPAIA